MTTAVLKDAALEEYYESLFMMFGSRGWQKLMEDVGHIAKTSDSLTGVETVEQLWFRKGQIDQILWLTGFRDACERAYNALLEEQETTPQTEPTGGRAKVVDPNAQAE
jgi:hypothetical protein